MTHRALLSRNTQKPIFRRRLRPEATNHEAITVTAMAGHCIRPNTTGRVTMGERAGEHWQLGAFASQGAASAEVPRGSRQAIGPFAQAGYRCQMIGFPPVRAILAADT